MAGSSDALQTLGAAIWATDQAQRNRGGVLHRAHHDAALDVGDQPQRQDLLAQEVVEGVHVAGDDAQLIVGRAGDRGALHHLRPALHRLLEGVEIVLGRQRQLDGAIDLEAEAQLLAVEDGHAALDDPLVLQPLDPPPAGAGGQARRARRSRRPTGWRRAGSDRGCGHPRRPGLQTSFSLLSVLCHMEIAAANSFIGHGFGRAHGPPYMFLRAAPKGRRERNCHATR